MVEIPLAAVRIRAGRFVWDIESLEDVAPSWGVVDVKRAEICLKGGGKICDEQAFDVGVCTQKLNYQCTQSFTLRGGHSKPAISAFGFVFPPVASDDPQGFFVGDWSWHGVLLAPEDASLGAEAADDA